MSTQSPRGRLANLVFTGLFLLFAALQYNDPDPWRWIPIYALAALLCYRYATEQPPQAGAILLMVFCVGYGAYLFMEKDGVISWAKEHHAENLVQTMKATKPWIENTREFGGLIIIVVVLGLNYLSARKA